MRHYKLPACPLCFDKMALDATHCGFLCDRPHGDKGPVFVGHDDCESGKFELTRETGWFVK